MGDQRQLRNGSYIQKAKKSALALNAAPTISSPSTGPGTEGARPVDVLVTFWKNREPMSSRIRSVIA